jgi:hypothetical protein
VVCRAITDHRRTAHRHKPWPQNPSITIDRHVTRNSVIGAGTAGTCTTQLGAKAGVTIDMVTGPKTGPEVHVQPAAGSSNAPTAGSTPTLTAYEGFLYLNEIALLLRRLDRSQLFGTL